MASGNGASLTKGRTAIKNRLAQSQFKTLLDDLLQATPLEVIVERLRSAGATTKPNAKHIRESFLQNVFHVARPLHGEVLQELWYEYVLKTHRDDPELTLLRRAVVQDTPDIKWNVPSSGLGDRSLGELLTNLSDRLGAVPMDSFLAISAAESWYGEYKNWLAARSVAERPSSVVVAASASMTEYPVEESESTPSLSSTTELPTDAPVLSAHLALGALLSSMEEPVADSELLIGFEPARLSATVLPEMSAQLRRLADFCDSLLLEIESLRSRAIDDAQTNTRWCQERGVSLNGSCLGQLQEAQNLESLRLSYDQFLKEREQALATVVQRRQVIQSQVQLLQERITSFPEIPADTVDTWQNSMQEALRFASDTPLADLASAIQIETERVLQTRMFKQVERRLQSIAQQLGTVVDESKRERISRKLRRITETKNQDLESQLEDIELMEDLLRSSPSQLPAPQNVDKEIVPQQIKVIHDFFSGVRLSSRKRAILIVPPSPEPLRVPISLELTAVQASALEVSVLVMGSGPLFVGVPEERRSFRQQLTIPAGVALVELNIPLPLPDEARRKLSERKSKLQLRVLIGDQEADLSWDPLFLSPAPTEARRFKNPLDISSPSSSDIKRLQLGVETRLPAIDSWIRSGRGHIYIAAPRRFGKTSVVQYCLASFAQNEELAVVRVDCSGLHGQRGQILKQVVRAIASRIGSNEGDCDALDRWQDTVDDWNRFERLLEKLRRVSVEKKISRIVVLIDEAQALFARQFSGNTYDFADRMKSFLENVAREEGGLTPLYFGFFGRLNLRHLFGQNLRDTFVNPSAVVTDLSDDEVESVLRSVNTDIQSTAPARLLLREYGINLVFLRDMFGTLCDMLAKEQRLFIIRSDAEAAIRELRERRDIFLYLRDLLNRSDDTNHWQPVRGYPVAVAIACAMQDDEFIELSKIAEQLNRLVGGESVTVDLIKSVLNDEEINDVVERKRENVRIRAEPLRHFLRERGQGSSDEMRRCLAELVLPEIELPATLDRRDKGGQAELFRGSIDGVECAVRKLLPDSNPIRFQREIAALKRLAQQRAPGKPAFQSLPELVKYGRTAEGRLITVCKWIDGVSLQEQLRICQPGGLPPLLVRTAIHQIASALEIVHLHNLTHRDIKPDNIIWSTHGVAVLIDFGLVRDSHSTSELTNAGTGLFVPQNGQGTPSGDLYALAMTTCVLLGGGVSAEHGKSITTGRQLVDKLWGSSALRVIDRALRSDVTDRGSAKEFAETLAGSGSPPTEFTQLRAELKKQLSGPEFERHRRSLTVAMAFAEGVKDEHLRLVVAAALASDLFDVFLKGQPQARLSGYGLSLASIAEHRDELASIGVQPSKEEARRLKAVAQLRNGFGHWNNLTKQTALAANTLGGPAKLREAVSEAVSTVGIWLFSGGNANAERLKLLQQIGAAIIPP